MKAGALSAALLRAPMTDMTPLPRSTGGVVASSASGLIVCSNTLDERLRIVYGQTLPEMRTALFGAVSRA